MYIDRVVEDIVALIFIFILLVFIFKINIIIKVHCPNSREGVINVRLIKNTIYNIDFLISGDYIKQTKIFDTWITNNSIKWVNYV